MSGGYTITPFSEQFREESVIRWLEEWGVEIPEDAQTARKPTLNEVKSVLARFSDFSVNYHISSKQWSADVQTEIEWRYININALLFSGNEDDPHSLAFGGDRDFIIQIIKELSHLCGTFLLLENGEFPTFIGPDTEI